MKLLLLSEIMANFNTIDDFDVNGKTVLVRIYEIAC